MCYVAGMRCILVLGTALLLGGCVYNPYTGLWQPAGYYGYYGYGYRPYYAPPVLWFPILRLLWLSVTAAPPNTAIRRLPAATKVLRSPQGRCKASRSRRSRDSLKRSSHHHLPAEDRLYCRLLAAVSSEHVFFVTKAGASPLQSPMTEGIFCRNCMRRRWVWPPSAGSVDL